MLVNVEIRGRIFPYELSGPRIIQSGKKKGSSVEKLMFLSRAYLVWLKNIMDSGIRPESVPNKLHLHLGWILNAGEFVKTSRACQYCSDEKERRTIQFFSVRHSYGSCSYGDQYLCCEDPGCKYRLLEEKSHLLPLKFSSLSYFRNTEQARMGKFFKEIFLGPGALDPEKAFQLFASVVPASQL